MIEASTAFAVDDLPRNASGKLLERVLCDR